MRKDKNQKILYSATLDTPLGPMLAVSDDKELYLLDFADRQDLSRTLSRLEAADGAKIVSGSASPIESIRKELAAYFEGTLKEFKTPYCLHGTSFQKRTWEALTKIPYGETRSYSDQARFLKKPTAYRAVAGANGANCLAIIIPCHRIINNNGTLGGYGGGIHRKEWLIHHEKQHC